MTGLSKAMFSKVAGSVAVGLAAVLAAGAAHADAREEVVAAFQKAMDDGSYRMVMTAENRGKPFHSTLDVQLPNRFYMKNEGGEFIILPGATWMNAGGQWMKMPVNMSQMIEGYSAEAMKQGMDAIEDVTYVGEETVEGCASKHYTYRARGQFMGIKSDSDTGVWICQDNGLPVRIVSSERGKKDQVQIVYDWDAPIDIKAPR